MSAVPAIPLTAAPNSPARRLEAAVLRAFDVIFAAVALALFAPLFPVLALAIRLETRGPVIYNAPRIGRGNRPFRMYKLRSMVERADRIGPYYTNSHDARITRVGRWLRKTSLDEVPQFVNVLTGDMSLVGPRPDSPAQVGLYTEEEWALRCSVRPGLTGLAQALLRNSATMEERKRLDLQYAGSFGIATYLRVVVLTLRQVLCHGSY